MDIKTLRSMRSNSDFSKIASEFEKTANPQSQSYEDDRFWKPERDKAGNATATIRFLPKTENDELPWVKIFSHGFKGPTGRWYIENSLTTLGQADPVSELNTKLWNSGSEANKEIARQQKRRLNYIANILVIDDPKHPENNGQVKLFKFGKKIFDKIMDKARPTFEDEDPVNVFDFWDGANFKLRMKTVDGYPNYDTSAFSDPAPIASDDEEILAIANKQYALSEFTDPKNFKSYDELKAKLEAVLSADSAPQSTAQQLASESNFSGDDEPAVVQRAAPPSRPAPQPKAMSNDDDDDAAFFEALALED